MGAVYVLMLAIGAPLLLWFAFAGDAEGEGLGDADGPLAVIPLSSIAFVMAFFGLTGLIGGATGAAAALVLVAAVIVGVGAGVVNSAAFAWLLRHSNSSDIADAELEGAIANVALPISETQRGKIIVTKAGAREQMTASPVDGSTIDQGERVVIVRVDEGVALVAPLGPELELE